MWSNQPNTKAVPGACDEQPFLRQYSKHGANLNLDLNLNLTLTLIITHAHHFSPRVVGQLACRLWKSRLRSEFRL